MRSRRGFVPVERWSDPRQRRGLWGERVAMAYLTSCGWHIEAHRFRVGHGDLDVVARLGALVAFVEVKTRGSARCGVPAESVGWRKRRTIVRLAEVWRDRLGRAGDCYRFDVVEVVVEAGGGYRLQHLADAWRPGCSARC